MYPAGSPAGEAFSGRPLPSERWQLPQARPVFPSAAGPELDDVGHRVRMIVREPIDRVPATGWVVGVDVANLSKRKLQIAAAGAPFPIQLVGRKARESIVDRRIRVTLHGLFLIWLRRLGYSPRPHWLVRVVDLRTFDGDWRPYRVGHLDRRRRLLRRQFCSGRLRGCPLPDVVRTLNRGPERKTRNAHDDGAEARLQHLSSLTSLAWFRSPMGFGRTIGADSPQPTLPIRQSNPRGILPDLHSQRHRPAETRRPDFPAFMHPSRYIRR